MFSILKKLGLKGRDKPKFKKTKFKPLAVNKGGCTATNRITVDGKKVGWMYRQMPHRHHAVDNGWSFFAGDESAEYLNDISNSNVYDTNTIANYDPDIIPFLDSPPFSAFERDPKTKKFKQVFDFEFPDR